MTTLKWNTSRTTKANLLLINTDKIIKSQKEIDIKEMNVCIMSVHMHFYVFVCNFPSLFSPAMFLSDCDLILIFLKGFICILAPNILSL
mmetsp:Transcript_34725/g.46597  ORF Transcript_34725/g.46597 Transcript_34725/m.46597 type:complete len:89 (+) Transcript_34725:180-446(+)